MLEKIIDSKLFIDSIHDKNNVKGYTHDFYNYPARFSPNFVREAIKAFSEPGDLIIDPFVGGGTTLVEARLLNRHSIGLDISSLATFIANTKITPLSFKEILYVKNWALKRVNNLNCRSSSKIPTSWEEHGYFKNISERATWTIRKYKEP